MTCGVHLHCSSSQQYSQEKEGSCKSAVTVQMLLRHEESLYELLNSNSVSITKSIQVFFRNAALPSLETGTFPANHGELDFDILRKDSSYPAIHPQ